MQHPEGDDLIHTWTTSRALCSLVLGSIVLVSGCESSAAPEGSEDGMTPFQAAFGYDPPAGIWKVDESNKAERECLLAAGFDVPPPAAPKDDGAEQVEFDAVRSAVDPQFDEDEALDPLQEYENSLSPSKAAAFRRAWLGTGSEPGCNERAMIETYGTGSQKSPTEKMIEDDVLSRMQSDPKLLTVQAELSSCLADYGIEVETPSEIGDRIMGYLDTIIELQNSTDRDVSKDPIVVEALAFERAAETAYRTCSDRVGWDEAYRQAMVRAETEFLDANPNIAESLP